MFVTFPAHASSKRDWTRRRTRPSSLEPVIRHDLRIMIGITVGGGLGFGWYKLEGCRTGACPLTSHPVIITIHGAV